MADEIVQRGLNLQVEAEDLASDTLLSLADQLDELEAKAATVFGAIGMAGEDAGSSLQAASQMFSADWESQLQGLVDFATTTFAGLEQMAAATAGSMGEVAAPIGTAWSAAATAASGAFDEAAGSISGSASKIAAALDPITTTLASLPGDSTAATDGISSALDDGAGAVNGAAGRLATALDPVSGALATLPGDTTAAADGIATALDDAASGISGSAGKAATALDPISKTLTGVTTTLSAWPDDFKTALAETATTVATEAAKIEASLTGIAGAEDKAGLGGAMTGGVVVGGEKAGKEKLPGETSALAGEETAIETAMEKGGQTIAGEIGSVFSKYMGGESSGGFYTGAGSKLLMGGLGATMMPSFMDMLAQAVEQIGGMQQIGGGKHPMTVSNALELSTLMSSVGINPQQQARMIARLEKNLLEGTGVLTGLSANNPLAAPESLGLGRLAANPMGVVLGGPTETMARLFAMAHVTPSVLQKMNAMQQMTALFQGLEKVPTQSARTAAIQELFGGGRGQGLNGMALLASSWPALVQQYGQSGAASAAATLAGVLPANATATAANLRMGATGLSMSLETLGIELIPVLTDFTKGLADFTKFLVGFEKTIDDIFHHPTKVPGDISALAKDVGEIGKVAFGSGLGEAWLGLGALRNKGAGGLLRKGVSKLLNPGDTTAAEAAAEETGGAAATAGLALPEIAAIFGPAAAGAGLGIALGGLVPSGTPSAFRSQIASQVQPGMGLNQVLEREATLKRLGYKQSDPVYAELLAAQQMLIAEHSTFPTLSEAQYAKLQRAHPAAGLSPSAALKALQTLAQSGGSSQKDSTTAEILAARAYGLNPAALLADSYAESSLNAKAVENKPYRNDKGQLEPPTYATGLFQFLPSTWAADSKAALGKALPFSDASNPYLAATVAGSAMKRSGIGGEKNIPAALRDIVRNFENPGAKGAAADIARGTGFLASLEGDLQKAEQAAKTHAPKIKQPVDKMLLDLVTDARKEGSNFSKATDDSLTKAETYLRQHKGPFTQIGRDLLEGLKVGLEQELPSLRGEARKIADELETTLRNALKTHSPSELTAAIGDDLMAGLGLGMERSTAGVARVAATQALQVAGALSAGTGTAGGAGQPMTLYLTLQLDGQQITKVVQAQIHQNTKLVAKIN